MSDTEENLIRLVVLADAELDRTMDIPAAIARLQIIRSRMVKANVAPTTIFGLTQAMAMMQPYLIQPYFMEME